MLQKIRFVRTLITLWRVFCAIALCIAFGALLGLVPLLQTRWGLDPWFGMAAGTIAGFILGTAWHLGTQRSVHGLSSLFVVSVLVALMLAAVADDKQEWAQLASLQNGNLQAIVVFDRLGRQQIVRVEDPAVLAAFAEGISDAKRHMPNHPRYSDTWFVVVEGSQWGTEIYQFEFYLNPKFPQSVIGSMVKRKGNRTSYQLTFQSDELRPWVDEHLLQAKK